MAARASRTDARVVLRAGDGEIARETRALLHVGTVRDAHHLVAIGLAGATLGRGPVRVVPDDGAQACIVARDGSASRWSPPADR